MNQMAGPARDLVPRTHAFVWIGITLGLGWTLFLAGLGLFSDGSLDPQWKTALIFVLLAASPSVVALIGRDRPGGLLAAGLISAPLSLMSLAGATLPLLIPAIFYFSAAGIARRQR